MPNGLRSKARLCPLHRPIERYQPSFRCARSARSFESGTVALDELDLEVRDGEFVSLLGPSGCGKSTALRIVAGLSAPSAGAVEWPAGAGKIGFVFQEPTLMPWADVAANVQLPLKLSHADEAQSRAAVHKTLERVGLTEFAQATRANSPVA